MCARVRLEPGHLRVERSARSAIVVPPKTSGGNQFGKGHGSGIPPAVLAMLASNGVGAVGRGPAAATYRSVVLADSPTGYWKLDDAGGALTAADSSGNNHPSTGQTNVTFNVAPLITSGTAASFVGGSTSRVSWDGTASLSLVTANWSAEAWIKTTASGSNQGITGCQDLGGGRWLFMYVGSTGLVTVNVFSSADGITQKIGSVVVNDGTRHHVVTTFGADNNVWIYVDGVADGGATAGPASHSVSGTQFRIGDRYTGSEVDPFTGTIDEVALYPAALSAARVLAHWNAGK